MAHKVTKMALAALVLGATMIPQVASAAAPAPALVNDNYSYKAGDWYIGATPPNVDYNKPVILFVQGLHSDYTTWYNTTYPYYDAAYNAGYRTAFVQLYDADGTGEDMWDNGWLLSGVIQKVRNYYGVNKLNIIAHSKGGIDTQTALVHYGAYPYVNLVHQLSTPNKGSELADMSYGDWTWWLGAIMGQQDDAVYVLQTSYMSYFRSITDNLTENNYTRTYMSGGTGDDGFFSATYYSRGFLPGEDDGAVAIYSAFGNPRGYYGFTDNGSERLSHTKMRYSNKTWWQVAPKLTTYNYYGAANMTASTNPATYASLAPQVGETSNTIMRGGEINGTATNSFVLESGLKNTSIDVMTSSNATQVKLVSPSGKVYTPVQGNNAGEEQILFANATHNVFNIDAPEKGEWKVEAVGNNDAYFMFATLDGGAKATVKANKKVHKVTDAKVDVAIAFEGGKANLKNVKNAKLSKAAKKGEKAAKGKDVAVKADSQGGLLASVAMPSEPGVYNLSFDVVGVNAQGEEFTRSVNYNFAVTDAQGNLKK